MTHTPLLQTTYECPICLTNDNQESFIRAFHQNEGEIPHIFHRSCVETWLANPTHTCPICRQAVVKIEVATPCAPSQEPAVPTQEPAVPTQEFGAPTQEPAIEERVLSATSILERHPFWTHRKAFSTACIVSGLTLWFTTSAMKSHPRAITTEQSLPTLALKLTQDSVAKHPKKCAAAIALLTMTPEILGILKVCLWDERIIRTMILSSLATVAVIKFGLPLK